MKKYITKWAIKNFNTILAITGLIALVIAGIFNSNGY